MKEWIAVVRYRTRITVSEREVELGLADASPGNIEVEYDLDDPSELAIIVEQGPGWSSILWVHLRRSCDERFPALPYEDGPGQGERENDGELC